MVTMVLVLYLKWAWQHPGNKTEHEAHAEYDVTSSILGKALVLIHCHVFAESLFWLTAQHSTLLPFFQETSTFFNQLSHFLLILAYSELAC
jgi:hypothetical protein